MIDPVIIAYLVQSASVLYTAVFTVARVWDSKDTESAVRIRGDKSARTRWLVCETTSHIVRLLAVIAACTEPDIRIAAAPLLSFVLFLGLARVKIGGAVRILVRRQLRALTCVAMGLGLAMRELWMAAGGVERQPWRSVALLLLASLLVLAMVTPSEEEIPLIESPQWERDKILWHDVQVEP